MAGNGGARPGAGRPRKRVKFAGVIAKAEKRIADRLPDLIDNMFELAGGAVIVEESEELAMVIALLEKAIDNPEEASAIVERISRMFSRPPDRQANEYLINRIMGKPTERKELTGENGEPIKIKTDLPKKIEELLKLDASELARKYREALGEPAAT